MHRKLSVLVLAIAAGILVGTHFHNPAVGFVAANAVCAAHQIRRRGYALGADFYSDGDAPFGSEIVTINGVDYVAEENTPDETSTKKVRKDEKGRPSGGLFQREPTTVNMILQLASLTTPIPEMLTVAVLPFRNANKKWLITRVGQPKKQDDFRKINVELTELFKQS